MESTTIFDDNLNSFFRNICRGGRIIKKKIW